MLADFVLETVNAPGTGSTLNLAGAPTGRRTFAAAFSSGETVYYYLDDGNQFEAGYGAFTAGSPNTLTRAVVLANSAGTTAKLNFGGTTRVYNEVPAARAVYADQNGAVAIGDGMEVDAAGNTQSIGVGIFEGGFATAPGAGPNFAVDGATGEVFTIKRFTGRGATPIGSGMDFWGRTLPVGWLWADGSAVSRATYADLFTEFSTTYGAGDGSTTFNLPDKRGRISLPLDNLGNTGAAGRVTQAVSGIDTLNIGNWGGDQSAQFHAHGVNDNGHIHGVNDPTHNHPYIRPTFANGSGSNITNASGVAQNDNTGGALTGVSIQVSGTGISIQAAGGGNSQNMPPVLVCNYIIYAGV